MYLARGKHFYTGRICKMFICFLPKEKEIQQKKENVCKDQVVSVSP